MSDDAIGYYCHFKMFYPTSINHYFEKEIDERVIQRTFNLDLINGVLPNVTILTKSPFRSEPLMPLNIKKRCLSFMNKTIFRPRKTYLLSLYEFTVKTYF
jgi:hypothetical protein